MLAAHFTSNFIAEFYISVYDNGDIHRNCLNSDESITFIFYNNLSNLKKHEQTSLVMITYVRIGRSIIVFIGHMLLDHFTVKFKVKILIVFRCDYTPQQY